MVYYPFVKINITVPWLISFVFWFDLKKKRETVALSWDNEPLLLWWPVRPFPRDLISRLVLFKAQHLSFRWTCLRTQSFRLSLIDVSTAGSWQTRGALSNDVSCDNSFSSDKSNRETNDFFFSFGCCFSVHCILFTFICCSCTNKFQELAAALEGQ